MSALARETIFGFAFLAVVMAALLFGCAGTLGYWQAWAFLFVFFASVALITIDLWIRDPQLLARRVRAGPNAESDPSQRRIQSAASLAFLAILIVPALDRRFEWSNLAPAFAPAADAVVALGFLIVARVFRENSFAGATIDVAAGQRVVASGPYAIVRHPMYAGALLMLAATPVALGSWWGLLAVAVMASIIVRRLVAEETLLAKQLDGYAEYRRGVRYRLVPFVW